MSNPDDFLLSLFRSLPGADQATLLAFAEFLHSRSGGQALQSADPKPLVIPDPEPIPRPPQESVIKAVKRLSQTYHMLDKNKILNETSTLVTQHVIQGRDAAEVIDELEVVFQRYYSQLITPRED